MKTYAFIFARGGSKGLPGKNTKNLLGKPLIAHSIDMANQISCIDRVFVSTDSFEIAQIAKNCGAEVPFLRPAELSSDSSPEWKAWQHAITYVQTEYQSFDRFVSLPATAPCRSAADVIGAIEKLTEDIDMVVTASKSSHHPCFNMLKVNAQGLSEKFMDSAQIDRRQDTEKAYNMTTVAYVSRPNFILSHDFCWQGRIKMQEVDALNAVDIDDSSDFKLAELILNDRLVNAYD